ncbi:MAG: FAD-dependent oxidoreductase [Parvibaculum sp.]|uniref:dihydrolipoyl dehydrogenase family protein n=1 Tax=Parvibaculum sp. TaxID=2024848 RepID=UPI0025CC37E0|nr:FAD-dependent oxidoreductase [Parvibaculum sp.]MCE9650984.1 FAD-dependent oxidoreductase [Parvibaculum sp.]
MAKKIKADICVIGAGSGGLSVAAGAAQLGARTVLVERGHMGGDCLNTGCVPSKALIAAAKHAYDMTDGARFGIAAAKPKVDFAKVNDHVKGVIAAIAPNDSVARFEGLGVTVLQGEARFKDRHTVIVGNTEIRARRFVVATGSRAAVPPIPGLADAPYMTNETIFENRVCPEHLVIIGGGPIGIEMAQAHRRLGAKVTVVEAARALSKDDPELALFVLDRLAREGVEIVEGARVESVSSSEGKISVALEGGRTIEGSHLLVATGRTANVDGLDLEKAGVKFSAHGIDVDDRLRTANKRIFAIGDAIGGLQFTHVANYHAGLVIRAALFRLPAKADYANIPWVTYTDPELAHVGETEAEARARHMKINVLRWHLAENDRAQATRETEGQIKVITDMHSRILGCTIVAPNAGELILPWVLAKSRGLKLSAMAGVTVPYPTLSEISKRVAGSYYTPTLFSPRTRALVRFLGFFG